MKFNLNIKSSKIDSIYRSILLTKFFTQGWGDPDNMKKILSFRKLISNCSIKLVNKDHPIYLDKLVDQTDLYFLYEGHFISPLVQYLTDLIPEESKIAKFQLLLPKKWKFPKLRPLCLHLAGTGDHYFWRRRNLMAKPLLKDAGIASIILENPFYGDRKPVDQKRSSLRNVSDIFIMGGCLILESLALFNWCEKMNFGPLCVTGISMGGHMASLVGASWNKPLSIVPCLSWTTASCVFTQGVLSEAIPWHVLENQYLAYSEDCRKTMKEMINSPENNEMFNAGRHFAHEFQNKLKIFKWNSVQNEEKLVTSNLKLNTLNFMKEIMDECTHLGNFSVPFDTDLVIVVTASSDGYVPKDGFIPLTDIWKGAKVRILDCGHITAILFKMDQFRKAIIDSLEINASKYHFQSLNIHN